jgi:hypothetical protein
VATPVVPETTASAHTTAPIPNVSNDQARELVVANLSRSIADNIRDKVATV